MIATKTTQSHQTEKICPQSIEAITDIFNQLISSCFWTKDLVPSQPQQCPPFTKITKSLSIGETRKAGIRQLLFQPKKLPKSNNIDKNDEDAMMICNETLKAGTRVSKNGVAATEVNQIPEIFMVVNSGGDSHVINHDNTIHNKNHWIQSQKDSQVSMEYSIEIFALDACPVITFQMYVERICKYLSPISKETIMLAMFLIHYAKQKRETMMPKKPNFSENCNYHLFAASIFVAMNWMFDDLYENKYYARIFGLTVQKLLFFENELCLMIEFNLLRIQNSYFDILDPLIPLQQQTPMDSSKVKFSKYISEIIHVSLVEKKNCSQP